MILAPGHSSLAYLWCLPLDLLKIDRAFVHDILTDPNVAAIARSIVLAHSLGLTVVAEGVEQQGQFDYLVEQGCTGYQAGYLFGRPVPAQQLLLSRSSLQAPGGKPYPRGLL